MQRVFTYLASNIHHFTSIDFIAFHLSPVRLPKTHLEAIAKPNDQARLQFTLHSLNHVKVLSGSSCRASECVSGSQQRDNKVTRQISKRPSAVPFTQVVDDERDRDEGSDSSSSYLRLNKNKYNASASACSSLPIALTFPSYLPSLRNYLVYFPSVCDDTPFNSQIPLT